MVPNSSYIFRLLLKPSGCPGLTKLRRKSPCPSSVPCGLPQLRLESYCLHMPMVFDITALLQGISGYLTYPEWITWHSLKHRNYIWNQTQRSGIDHRTCKSIIPSALTYWDVPSWKYDHEGSGVGPWDTCQERFVDWLWTSLGVAPALWCWYKH